MPYAITNIKNEPAEIKFKTLETNESFDYITTDITLRTKLNKILKYDSDTNTLFLDGVLEGKSDKLLLIEKNGNTTTVNIENKTLEQDDNNFSNIIKTKFGEEDSDIITDKLDRIRTTDRLNYAERGCRAGDYICYLDYTHKKIVLLDLEGNQTKSIDCYDNFKYVYNIFDDSDNIYIACSKFNDKFIVISKSDIGNIEKLSEDNTTYLELNLDNIDTDKFTLGKVYRNDYMVYDNNVIFSIESKGIFYFNLDMKEVYCISDDIDIKDRILYSFVLVDNEIYILACGSTRIIYKVDYDGSSFEISTYMTHGRYLDNAAKSYFVINSKIYDHVRGQIIDIENKTFNAMPHLIRRLPYLRAVPYIFNGKLLYPYNGYLYKASLDIDKIELFNQTIVNIDTKLNESYSHCTIDTELKYIINDVDYTDKLTKTTVNIKKSLVSSNFTIAFDTLLTDIGQVIKIGKNRVSADKFITYAFKKKD